MFYFFEGTYTPSKDDGFHRMAQWPLTFCRHVFIITLMLMKMSCNDSILNHVSYLQLPVDILQKILVFVVLEDCCSAILRLALTCQRFNNRMTKTVRLATREMDNGECFWGFTLQMTTLATVARIAL